MSLAPEIAAFYTQPGPMTDPRELDRALADAPTDIAGMVPISRTCCCMFIGRPPTACA
ncbi:MAG: hypothetical protein JO294_02190 [Alphaproteobacteria bacterium]|nr:hypothetical protein [Alphaproteobacteria bacterium]